MILQKFIQGNPEHTQIFLLKETAELDRLSVSREEYDYLQSKLNNEKQLVEINRFTSRMLVICIPPGKKETRELESWRRKGNEAAQWAREEKIESLVISSFTADPGVILAFAEGILLGSYQFLKYNSNAGKVKTALQEVYLREDRVTDRQLSLLNSLSEAVCQTRDLVNEPVLNLNAVTLGNTFFQMGREAGLQAEVLGKEEIEALGMGGLLAVNKGSVDPPTFTILEWNPENAVNEQPVVLVGKGVVFDTGGLSLKPTPKSMDYMKSDMAGAAAVAAAICTAALNKLPVRLVALVPATDNRPGGNAVTPGDVITISGGTTVEVLNTDAEGRLILADALVYAKKYNPLLVIDLATLTGSAAMTLGIHGIAGMCNDSEALFELLKKAGEQVSERIVELPLWEEYDEMIKSAIADMKNIGGGEAGAITAGKFLQRFTGYPWIHLDIAGPSFLHAADHYRTAGGTGVGVRLLVEFFHLLAERLSADVNSKE
jgi:leucyl aminopeptidase